MKINIYPMLKFLEGVSMLKLFFVVVMFPTGMVFVTIMMNQHKGTEYTVTHEVYFDIEIAGEPKGQMVIGLFGETVPLTVQNFYTLATTGVDGNKYQGTVFHRVIKKFMIQGGDVLNASGLGRLSIYGETFPDENFDVKHATPGFVAMANSGPDSNACQFYITTTSTPWLDGKHVVFGKVIEGQGYVHLIEHQDTDYNDRPIKEIRIAKSGSRKVRRPYTISDDPYNLWDWMKTISFPLSLSFSIIFLFNYFIKQLDRGIETEEAFTLLKKKAKAGKLDDEETRRLLLGDDDEGREGLRKRGVAAQHLSEELVLDDEEENEDVLLKKIQDYKKFKVASDAEVKNLSKEALEKICKNKNKSQ